MVLENPPKFQLRKAATSMTATKKVRFLFFDHGGTLAQIKKDTPQIVLDVLHEYGHNFSFEEIGNAYTKAEEYWETKIQHLHRGKRFASDLIVDYYQNLLSYLGIQTKAVEIAEKIDLEWHDRAEITLYPDTLPCLEAAKNLRLPMGIITQTLRTEEEFRRLHLREEGIEQYFSTVITSEDAGYDKPDRRLYVKAAELAGYPPQEIIHVGDNYELDVTGARLAGMRAVLLDRHGSSPSYKYEKIDSLLELLRLLS